MKISALSKDLVSSSSNVLLSGIVYSIELRNEANDYEKCDDPLHSKDEFALTSH